MPDAWTLVFRLPGLQQDDVRQSCRVTSSAPYKYLALQCSAVNKARQLQDTQCGQQHVPCGVWLAVQKALLQMLTCCSTSKPAQWRRHTSSIAPEQNVVLHAEQGLLGPHLLNTRAYSCLRSTQLRR